MEKCPHQGSHMSVAGEKKETARKRLAKHVRKATTQINFTKYTQHLVHRKTH